jgi:hypothetical protein
MPPDRRRNEERRRERGEPYEELPEAVQLHEAYLEHRLAGGETPSAQLYLQAVERFRQLPGAVRSRPAVSPPGADDDQDADGDQASDEGGQG